MISVTDVSLLQHKCYEWEVITRKSWILITSSTDVAILANIFKAIIKKKIKFDSHSPKTDLDMDMVYIRNQLHWELVISDRWWLSDDTTSSSTKPQ